MPSSGNSVILKAYIGGTGFFLESARKDWLWPSAKPWGCSAEGDNVKRMRVLWGERR